MGAHLASMAPMTPRRPLLMLSVSALASPSLPAGTPYSTYGHAACGIRAGSLPQMLYHACLQLSQACQQSSHATSRTSVLLWNSL